MNKIIQILQLAVVSSSAMAEWVAIDNRSMIGDGTEGISCIPGAVVELKT